MSAADQARFSESRYGREAHGQDRRRNAGVQDGRRSAAASSGPRHAASRAEGVEAYASRRRKKGRARVLKGLLVVLLALVVSGVGVALAYINHINGQLGEGISDEFRRQLNEASVEPQDPFYMLILGVDKSEGRSEEWGDSTANFRADTIILARVDPKGQKVTLVSIPRDTYTDLGDGSKDKINGAYSLGGPEQMVEAVERFSGAQISHYAEIDFEQFTSIVDTIGGVEVTLPVDVKDTKYAGIDLEAGTHTLDGTTALALVRSRHAYDEYGGGDFYRAANQRMVIYAILKKILSLDVASMTSTVSQLSGSVTTDFSVTDLLGLAMQFTNLDVDNNIYSGQAPTISQYVNQIWYEMPDEEGWRTMMERVENGESPYSDASQDFTAGVAGSVGNGTITSEDGSGPATPTFSGSVLVLNGTTKSGLALNTANSLNEAGFEATADNAASSDYQQTAVLYNASRPDAQGAALGAAQTLGVSQSYVARNDGTYSTDYDVVVVLGADSAS